MVRLESRRPTKNIALQNSAAVIIPVDSASTPSSHAVSSIPRGLCTTGGRRLFDAVLTDENSGIAVFIALLSIGLSLTIVGD